MEISYKEYKELISKGAEVHAIGPYGNMGKVDPTQAAWMADQMKLKWYTTAWPYSSGVTIFCTKEQFNKIREFAKEK